MSTQSIDQIQRPPAGRTEATAIEQARAVAEVAAAVRVAQEMPRDEARAIARMRKGSVLRFPRPTGRKVRHPSEKPVPLLRELVESSSRQGETVLDPFAGIGSTGVAAVLSGRRTVLVEIERRWADVAVDRVRRAEEIARLGEAS